MNNKLQPVRGTKDLFGNDIELFNYIIQIAKKRSISFGFEELQTPIFEFSEIFERNLGESSDIISKEVYKFQDRSENFLTLRPEFTAGVVRAIISNQELIQNLPKKLFSYGPIFRYDRPQKGRQRQFHQVNFEIFGSENYFCDVEAILLIQTILKDFGISKSISLQINSLGCIETKNRYEIELKKYFEKFKNDLSNDSKIRLEKNPLRILDSKHDSDIKILQDAPKISHFFSDDSRNRFEKILSLLTEFKIEFFVNEKLVRGLDYYTSTVFEFINDHDGAQNAVIAGGRYDNLVEKMSGKNIPAIGFAAGIERLMLLIKNNITKTRPISVNYISLEEKEYAFKIANDLRLAGFLVDFSCDDNFKKQMKKASQNNCRFVVIVGGEELKNNETKIKDFDNQKEYTIKYNLVVPYIEGRMKDL